MSENTTENESFSGPIAVTCNLEAGDSSQILSSQMAVLLAKNEHPMSIVLGIDIDESEHGGDVKFKVVTYGPPDELTTATMLLMAAQAIKGGTAVSKKYEHADGTPCSDVMGCDGPGRHA